MEEIKNKNIENMFNVMSMSQLLEEASTKPMPKDLYHSLITEGEVAVIYAETGIGKSVFAMQIADSISRVMPVLYIDLELTDIQILKRYKDESGKCYEFSDNFQIAHRSDMYKLGKKCKVEDSFVLYIEDYIKKFDGERVCVVVDNMTMLYEGDMNKAKDVKPLMDNLKELSIETGATLILIEHTKKTSNYMPISLNDMAGSKMKSYPIDSLIAIGRSSQGENIRYVKQLKTRSSEKIYTEENIALYCLEKVGSFLGFTYLGTDSEYNHLARAPKVDKAERNAEILSLLEQGMKPARIAREISEKYGKLSDPGVRRIIKESKEGLS